MLSKALQAAAGNAGEALFVDSVFSSYLYTGNGSTQTITNNIDLAGEGGMVWIKARSAGYLSHVLTDTARGNTKILYSNLTAGQDTWTDGITSFGATGFSVGVSAYFNQSSDTYASWTFRKQPKFFDVVTWTGDGVSGKTVAHNLGSVPGAVIIKRTDSTSNWTFWHRQLTTNNFLRLNLTDAQVAGAFFEAVAGQGNVNPTDSVITLGNSSQVNASGGTYVAYLFAHDAGGFGADGSENVISCGSFTTGSSGGAASVTLGYEPQWLLIKPSSTVGNWLLFDDMRGMPVGSADSVLQPNLANAESTGNYINQISATGFTTQNLTNNETYIYIAIRRPMKPPSSGTEVFAIAQNTSSPFSMTAGFPVDSWWYGDKAGTNKWFDFDRLRGNNYLKQNTTDAEVAFTVLFDSMTTVALTSSNATGYIQYAFKRAPSFFDVVCYTGASANTVVNHNLGVAPELMFVKHRSGGGILGGWATYSATYGPVYRAFLNTTGNFIVGSQASYWGNGITTVAPTATQITLGGATAVSDSGANYVAYLFATYPGVSKVGSYIGNGSSQTINCGFTSGARFVLIKRTDSTGSWWTFDSARGIVAGNDPALQLNSTAAEVTSADAVDADSTGFVVNQEATCNLNVNAASYIFLSIS